MPSQTYNLFHRAMQAKKQIACSYDGYPRLLCPTILGHTGGEEKALTFQFGGDSKSGLPRGGEWRCLSLSRVSDAQLRDGPWLAGDSHTRRQVCVGDVDFDINPQSPYAPKRRLRARRRDVQPPR